MYRVIKYFTDLQDNNRPYKVGDIWPRDGLEVSKERITELLTAANRQHTPVIKKAKEEPLKRERKAKNDDLSNAKS